VITSKVYYAVKPFLPWCVRIALRRSWAHLKRGTSAAVWPIDEKAGASPPGWPGWPEGKRFALVLTHDVEGRAGLGRVEMLMRLEREYGFVSSFNFVPEGEYRVPDSLRQTLEEAGFEVGVHGLQHDGRLYSSKKRFAANATRIREYLQRWNVSGFRSPLMQHRLAWLHELHVEYDASTFDTDPFEPQSDGVGTVFPFWVPTIDGGGYVELPYTLPQDFTLFVLLREQDINIWKRKIDWIAAHGGMALINTHPDYMSFGETTRSKDAYPASRYEEFLRYVRNEYASALWAARPIDVARYYRETTTPASRNTRRKVCMLAYTIYDTDNRVRRYAETLAKRGDKVDVIALARRDDPPHASSAHGVSLDRIQRRELNERHKWAYALRLFRFLVASSLFLTRQHHRERYDVIHVHNVPDFLVFAAWYPKLTGAKLILDIHDIVPELFAAKFGTKGGRCYARILKLIEKLSAGFVDHVIISNDLWYETLTARSVQKEKASVFLNHVDPDVFYRRRRSRNDGRFIILFPGTFQWHQGLDIAIRAFAHVKYRVPNAEFHLYGGGGGSDAALHLAELADQLRLNGAVRFFAGVPLERIADIMADADLGVVPKRADSFGNEAYSTKIMEFMSQGVPVVASRTKIDSFYFDDTLLRFFPSGDDQAMAEAMLEVIENQELRNQLIANGYEYVAKHGWDSKKRTYLELIDSLSVERFS